MGAAATRSLASSGVSVAVVAPPEPSVDDPTGGPYGAHYDVARLSWIHHADEVETELARRSTNAIAEIEAYADEPIYARAGSLLVVESGLDEAKVAAAIAEVGSGTVESLSPAEAAARFPELAIPPGATVLFEPPPSGYFNPRQLVAAQLRAAVRDGAEQFLTAAIDVTDGTVTLRDGREIRGEKVLVAAGAYVNTPGLLPRPVALRKKTETVLMARVGPAEARRLGSLPPVIYALTDPMVEDIYTAPPLRYPDGSMLLKWGANSLIDTWVDTLDETNAFYRRDSVSTDEVVDVMAPSMFRFYPGLEVESYSTLRCVVAYSGHGFPYIDAIEPGRLYLAAGGNGHSAKWSAALGQLAGSLVLNDAWVDPLPQDKFRVQWAGEVDSWAGKDLLSTRRS
jgi:sarcosine oxidase